MKNYLNLRKLSNAGLILSMSLTLALFATFAVGRAEAKAAPLNLADVLTGLRSKKTSLTQRNKLLTAAVKQRGVTFTLTTEIEKELKTAGASSELLQAIRQKNPIPPTVQNNNPSSVLNSFDVEHNVFINGKKGMIIRPKLTVYNLKNQNLEFNILIETADGRPLKAVSAEYTSNKGSLIVGEDITPTTDAAAYNNIRFFLPYQEFALVSGTHDLRMNIYLMYDTGTLINRFNFYYFQFQR